MINKSRETGFGLGLVAGKWNSELYLVIFEEQFNHSNDISAIKVEDFSPLFASSSLDAKVWHGHWPVLREGVDVSFVIKPIYKIEEPAGIVAESFDRKTRQLVDGTIAAQFPYRKTVAPVRLENALKAQFGVSPWDPIFDELRYENVVKASAVLNMN